MQVCHHLRKFRYLPFQLMARIWTRKRSESADKDITADPWHTMTADNAVNTSPEGSNLEMKAKPEDRRVYNTESGR